jgi:hypothetical protein
LALPYTLFIPAHGARATSVTWKIYSSPLCSVALAQAELLSTTCNHFAPKTTGPSYTGTLMLPTRQPANYMTTTPQPTMLCAMWWRCKGAFFFKLQHFLLSYNAPTQAQFWHDVRCDYPCCADGVPGVGVRRR